MGVIEPVLAGVEALSQITHSSRAIFMAWGDFAGVVKGAATADVPYPNLWMVPQAKTEEILRDRLGELGGKVEFGVGLTGFTQRDGGVEAVLSNGETVYTQYLVGCDGARSLVRKTLGLELMGELLAEKATLVADVEVAGLDRNNWHIWPLNKGGPLGLCPLPGTEVFQTTAPAERQRKD